MNLHKYDPLLSFDLPADFHIIKDVDDEGEPTFGIGNGKTVDEDGENSYACRLNIVSKDQDGEVPDPGSSAVRLEGNIQNIV